MTFDELAATVDRLLDAIRTGDDQAVRDAYAPDAELWHNFDQRNQTVEENIATLHGLRSVVRNLRYEEIRRVPAPGGLIQQHVLRGDGPAAALELPAMIRFFGADGRITRLEEYLDTAQFRAAVSMPVSSQQR
jgi:ketosteroid isomerase-like protein